MQQCQCLSRCFSLVCTVALASLSMAGCGGQNADENQNHAASNPPGRTTAGSTVQYATKSPGASTGGGAASGTGTTSASGPNSGTTTNTSSTNGGASAGAGSGNSSSAGANNSTSSAPGAGAGTTNAGSAAGSGESVFKQNCGRCHKIGSVGSGQIPLDHIGSHQNAAWLQVQIRTPQAHHSKMPAFPPDRLSDKDLHAVVQYLLSQK